MAGFIIGFRAGLEKTELVRNQCNMWFDAGSFEISYGIPLMKLDQPYLIDILPDLALNLSSVVLFSSLVFFILSLKGLGSSDF